MQSEALTVSLTGGLCHLRWLLIRLGGGRRRGCGCGSEFVSEDDNVFEECLCARREDGATAKRGVQQGVAEGGTAREHLQRNGEKYGMGRRSINLQLFIVSFEEPYLPCILNKNVATQVSR